MVRVNTSESKLGQGLRRIRLGLPKGRFMQNSLRVLADLGCDVGKDRRQVSWQTQVDDFDLTVKLLKVQDIPLFLQESELDFGVSSDEWMSEHGVVLPVVLELGWCRTSIVYAVPMDWERPSATRRLKVATSFPRLARQYFRTVGVRSQLVVVAGSCEALVPDICDSLVDCVETGQTLAQNGLKVADTIMLSSVHLFAARQFEKHNSADFLRRIFQRHQLT